MPVIFPIPATAWAVLLALGITLAGLGWEYCRRPIFSAPTHWTNNAAYAVMIVGRTVVFVAVLLFVGGQVTA